MNHIKNLQNKVNAQASALATFDAQMTDFRVYLASAKFTGTASDGSRKDWISTADVLNWIRETQRNVNDKVNA